jgi:hypothetical protein
LDADLGCDELPVGTLLALKVSATGYLRMLDDGSDLDEALECLINPYAVGVNERLSDFRLRNGGRIRFLQQPNGYREHIFVSVKRCREPSKLFKSSLVHFT